MRSGGGGEAEGGLKPGGGGNGGLTLESTDMHPLWEASWALLSR